MSPSTSVRLLLLALCATTAEAAPCRTEGTPWLALEITVGAVTAGVDRAVRVEVHDNGCVALHRPSFYRQPGAHRLALKPAELATLRARFDAGKLRGFDGAKVREAITQTDEDVAKSGMVGAERFTVVDADHFRLDLRDGASMVSVAWSGLHAYAKQYPQIESLQSFSVMALAAQALLERDDAVAVQGVAP
jgi:hypothetical protein